MSTTSFIVSGGYNARKSRRRLWSLGLALGLHVILVAFFLVGFPRANGVRGLGDGAMDVFLAGPSRVSARPVHSASAAKAAPAPPVKPAPPASTDPIKPRSVLAIVSDILSIPLAEHSVTPTPLNPAPSPVMAQAMAQASGVPGAACDIDGAIQTALRADPTAHGAILTIPIKDRSAADAVLMWNGQWVSPADVGGEATFDTLRVTIRQVVAAAKPECRDLSIVGPVFMLIPDGSTTFVVVFGNASWRWSDLLIDPATQS